MNLKESFKAFIQTAQLFHPDAGLLLAVSGGVDSVVLTKLCVDAGYKVVIAHANFQLRGEESERDESFVRALAQQYGLDLVTNRFETQQFAATQKISIQVAARVLRYGWFEELLNHSFKIPGWLGEGLFKPAFIVTAHHADDNIETALLNYFKGTGIRGMRGMLPKQGNIIRPLLFATKEDLVKYAEEEKLAYVEDSSNAEDKYSRNYLRHQVLPVLKSIYPEVETNLFDNISRFRETAELFQQAITQHKKKMLHQKGNEIHIPVEKIRRSEPLNTIVYEIFREFGFESSQVKELIRLFDSESGRYLLSPTHRVLKNRNWLIISPHAPTDSAQLILVEHPGKYKFEAGLLNVQMIGKDPNGIVSDAMIASLDGREIKFPLFLRKWKPGDYFYPLGMKKKKKLSRFFIDQKMSLAEKERTWVLEMDKKILWVVGKRIDERFRLREDSKNYLLLEFKPGQ